MSVLAYLHIGKEAVAVGICAAARGDDYITSTHRGHSHSIAKGGDSNLVMAENQIEESKRWSRDWH